MAVAQRSRFFLEGVLLPLTRMRVVEKKKKKKKTELVMTPVNPFKSDLTITTVILHTNGL